MIKKLEVFLYIYVYRIVVFVMTRNDYGIGYFKKLAFALRTIKNRNVVVSGTSWHQNLNLCREILSIPRSVKGDVVECGSYNGASTIPLSLMCAMTGRRLYVCDSFEGLPEPEPDEVYDINGRSPVYNVWSKGDYDSKGGVQGVMQTVSKYGNLKSCTFVKGYYEDTLPELTVEHIAFVFEDADLASSARTCIEYLWPKMNDGAKFYTHEPWSIKVVGLFYDEQWWKDKMNTTPPGFFGSGTYTGYSQKFNSDEIKKTGIPALGKKHG